MCLSIAEFSTHAFARTMAYLATIRDVHGVDHVIDMRQIVQITLPRRHDDVVSLVTMDDAGVFKTILVHRTDIPPLHPCDEIL